MEKCKFCAAQFAHRSSRIRHEKERCTKKNKIKIHIRPKEPTVHGLKMNIDMACLSKMFAEELHKRDERIEERLEERIERQNRQFMEEISRKIDIINQTKQTITNNFNYIGKDFYLELINKIGKDRAIHMLASNSLMQNSLNILKTLYIDGNDPDTYPIACRSGNHFRYINEAHELIDDIGGEQLQNYLSKKVSNAMLHATNDIIEDMMKGDEGQLMDQYDIRDIQKRMNLNDTDKMMMISTLARITENLNHPFFRQKIFFN